MGGVSGGPPGDAPGGSSGGSSGGVQRPRALDWAGLAVPVVLLALLVAFLIGDPSVLGLQPHSVKPGGPGIGDPDFPDAGNSGYDVLGYHVDGSWDPASTTLSATTTLTAQATGDLKAFYLDLYLTVTAVTVNGKPAGAERADDLDVKITPQDQISTGDRFTVTVTYSGGPQSHRTERGAGWYGQQDEWIVNGEPGSAPWWYPSNDHPSDPATFELTMRVPAGMEVISVGRLMSKDTGHEPDFDTWHWRLDSRAATYLTFMAVGQFTLREEQVDGRQAVYAVSQQLGADQQATIMKNLRTSGAVIKRLERDFGPYPFGQIGGVVPAARVPFAGLEAQTRPIYEHSAMASPGYAGGLLTHELAHEWFGDHVTVSQWNDIFDNEAYASFAAWLDAERQGGTTAQQAFEETFDQYRGDPGFWGVTMSDPGRNNLFTTVYERGPMTLQALRNVMGDTAFLQASRAWAQQPGTRSLEDWRAFMQQAAGRDLGPFFAAWLDGTSAPPQTAEYGFMP